MVSQSVFTVLSSSFAKYVTLLYPFRSPLISLYHAVLGLAFVYLNFFVQIYMTCVLEQTKNKFRMFALFSLKHSLHEIFQKRLLILAMYRVMRSKRVFEVLLSFRTRKPSLLSPLLLTNLSWFRSKSGRFFHFFSKRQETCPLK